MGLTTELQALQEDHGWLQEDHSIVKEDLRQLEEKCSENDRQYTELSGQLQEAQLKSLAQRSKPEESDVKLKVAETRLEFFKGKLSRERNQLCEVKDRSRNYLK